MTQRTAAPTIGTGNVRKSSAEKGFLELGWDDFMIPLKHPARKVQKTVGIAGARSFRKRMLGSFHLDTRGEVLGGKALATGGNI